MADSPASSPPPLSDEHLRSALEDIDIMLRHSRSRGLTVPESVRQGLATLCYGAADSAEDAAASGELTAVSASPASERERFTTALAVHGALSQLIAPATAVTVSASETPNGKIVGNPTLSTLLRASLVSLGFFIVITVVQQLLAGPNAPGWVDQVFDTFGLIVSAALGSAFYGLSTAHKYIVRSTFDPRYEQTYFVRFFLGVTAGTILGYFGKYLLDPTAENDTLQQLLGPPVLALLGGYASEAVSQILSRVAETLVTIVRGSDSDVLQARREALRAQAKQTETQLKADLLLPLQEARTLALGGGSPEQVKAAILKAFDTVRT